MHKLSMRQRTLASAVSFSGFGVHSASAVTLTIAPAAPNSGYLVARRISDVETSKPVPLQHSRVIRTTLCTTLDLGDSLSVATVEHVISALSGLGIDNALIVIDGGAECPILDGSAFPFVSAILEAGLEIQPAMRRFIKVNRAVSVRHNDAFATLEPYNGRVFDLEIDFDSRAIGRQRMIFDWSPRRYVEEISRARTFGFASDARVLRQAGYALGSSLENSVTIENDTIMNPGGLRYEDEFVRHKLLDAVGDLAIEGGMAIYGRFRSYKGGHALNAQVLQSLFASAANYDVVEARDLPLSFDALDDMPRTIDEVPSLRAVV